MNLEDFKPMSLIEIEELEEKVRQMGQRPSWTDYFLGIAFEVSRRSPDIHTKHGCVITTKTHQPIGVGYNGWPRKMKDDTVPTHRPDPDKPDEPSKYDYVGGCHSERNAISNCMVSPWLFPQGVTAYITGQPCNDCLGSMINANVTEIFHAKRQGSRMMNAKSQRVFEHIVGDTGIRIVEVVPDLNWMFEDGFREELRSLGFVD